MVVEGVTFNDRLVRMMGKEEFIRVHMPVFFQDRDEGHRKKMLSEIYDRICGVN